MAAPRGRTPAAPDLAREVHDVIQKWTRRGYIVPEAASDIDDDLRPIVLRSIDAQNMTLLALCDEVRRLVGKPAAWNLANKVTVTVRSTNELFALTRAEVEAVSYILDYMSNPWRQTGSDEDIRIQASVLDRMRHYLEPEDT